jgi:hypothetical protein
MNAEFRRRFQEGNLTIIVDMLYTMVYASANLSSGME